LATRDRRGRGDGEFPRDFCAPEASIDKGHVMTTLRDAIGNASSFLAASVDTASGTSLVRRLSDRIPQTWGSSQDSNSPPFRVVSYCLDLLETIHRASTLENDQLGVKDWRHLNALIDIVIALGLYKVLPLGVGPSETVRKQSVLLAREAQNARYSQHERKRLEEKITATLKSIIDQGGKVGDTLQRKHFIDILSGIIDLAFNPEYPQLERTVWKTQYDEIIASK